MSPPRISPLEQRVRTWASNLDVDAAQFVRERLRTGARDRQMWMGAASDDVGVVDISFVPGLIDPAALGYLHYVAWQLRGAVGTTMAHALPHLEFAAGEQEWFDTTGSETTRTTDRPFCRLDVLIGPAAPGEAPDIQLIEVNSVGVGGLNYVRDAAHIWLDAVDGQAIDGIDGRQMFQVADPRQILWDEFLASFDHPVGSVAVVELQETYDSDGEIRRIIDWIRRRDVDAVFVEPHQIEMMRGDHIVAGDEPVDAILRMVDLADLSAAELDVGGRFHGLRTAFKRGLVWPPLSWEGDHKVLMEWMQTPECLSLMTASQREVVFKHVLWTRSFADRETTGPGGRTVELVRYARHQRRSLVLKPDRGYGGDGVLLGAEASQPQWERAIDGALNSPETMVIQRSGGFESVDIPALDDEAVEMTEHYTVAGLFPGSGGVGVLGRFADDRVVNISRGAGVMPFFVDMS